MKKRPTKLSKLLLRKEVISNLAEVTGGDPLSGYTFCAGQPSCLTNCTTSACPKTEPKPPSGPNPITVTMRITFCLEDCHAI